MDEQIEESKEHAARFQQTLAKAAKRFAALAKVEERHANHYKATLAKVNANQQPSGEMNMRKWECIVCGYVYDEADGDSGTRHQGRHALGRHPGGLGLPGVRHRQSRLRNGIDGGITVPRPPFPAGEGGIAGKST